MKSIKTKIIILVITFVVLSSLAIGTASMISSFSTMRNSSIQTMNLLCENKTNDIDTTLIKIEESVKTLAVYAKHQIKDIGLFKRSQQYVDEYSNNLFEIATNAAINTEGASTVYIRFNPNFTNPQSGLFCVKDNAENKFVKIKPTDLSLYSQNDTSYVGWFYKAKEKGEAIWIEPYYNENIKNEIISYVIPLYIDNEFIGVVGMDIDFSFLTHIVSQTKIFNSGYAFLVDDKASILYHHELKRGTNLIVYNQGEFEEMAILVTKSEIPKDLIDYQYGGITKRATYRLLSNNMRFVTSVPLSEIDANSQQLLTQMLITMVIIISIAIILTFIFTKRLVRPLIELTEAAKRMASGDLGVSIEHHSQDEVGALAESFRQTVDKLDQQFSYVNSLAYTDPLTGIFNKTAYLQMVSQIDQLIKIN